ncbi:hypothetical protein A5672_11430 [Mycobacterium alsense]|uniref:DUF1361 domain-containing protein n=1 Tax=Mycobacterium alsense TaxID=324058 RepID=A0ABD6P407_9MYCO|nr:hypothetical protein A5672_11430 [Mycobacterium alsense]
MTRLRRVVLIASLVATTGLTLVVGVTDPAPPPTYPTRFFAWNLALAWIPMFFAAGFAVVRRRIWLVPLGLAWLAFLPNAPYLVTDLVHLDTEVELWRHIMQYGVAAWTGMMLGVVSMRLVCQRVERDFGAAIGWVAAAVSVGLCGIGVMIGRFQRWNSWDLVTQPGTVAATTFDWVRSPLAYVEPVSVALAVGAFFGLAYLTLWSLWPPARARRGAADEPGSAPACHRSGRVAEAHHPPGAKPRFRR